MNVSTPRTGTIAVVGEQAAVEGYGLAGAVVTVAEDPAAVREAVRGLPAQVALVILTRAAAAALVPDPVSNMDRQVVVLP
jgi:vacuolar-type H+-ATPase subunit F/Vma7